MISRTDTVKLLKIADLIQSSVWDDKIMGTDLWDIIQAQIKIAFELGKASK